MRVQPFIMLIAAGTVTAVLSTACGETGLDPVPPTTIVEGVVRYRDTLPFSYSDTLPFSAPDSVWLDSIPVSGGYVSAIRSLPPGEPPPSRPNITALATVPIGLNGEYHMELTVRCNYYARDRLKVGPNLRHWLPNTLVDPLEGVCRIPNIRYDIWVVPTE